MKTDNKEVYSCWFRNAHGMGNTSYQRFVRATSQEKAEEYFQRTAEPVIAIKTGSATVAQFPDAENS